LIEEALLIEQTNTSVLLHLVVLHHMTDDTAHMDTFYNTTIAYNCAFRAENTDSFAVYRTLSDE